MIEVPRGAVTADEIAKEARVLLVRHQRPHADGLRPEPRRRLRSSCSTTRSTGCSSKDPFVTIDAAGVGLLVEIGVKKGRSVKPKPQDRRLRRARRRPGLDPLLPRGRASTTCPARPTGCRSRGSRRRRPSSSRRRATNHLRDPARFVERDPEGPVRSPGPVCPSACRPRGCRLLPDRTRAHRD